MAIRNILKSTAQGILGKNLRRVAGGFANLIGGPNRTDSADFNNRTKQATNMLSFPIDVGNEDPSMGNHGHYIMFFINEQKNAKLKFDNVNKSLGTLIGADNLFKEAKKRGFGILEKVVDSVTGKVKPKPVGSENYMSYFFKPDGTSTEAASKIINDKLKTGDINKKPQGTKENSNQTISIDRAPTRRLDSVITMFMPADVKVNYKSNYTDQTIGIGTQTASQAIGEGIRTGSFDAGVDAMMKNTGDLAASATRNALLTILSAAPMFEGAKEAVEIGLGTALTDRMEMAFKGIDKRKFQYTFKMLPKSQEEADMVYDIVLAFKKHSAASFKDGNRSGKTLIVPDTFNIQYMYDDNENQYIHKISTCVCKSVNVTYGGSGGYQTFEELGGLGYDGAAPIETSIALAFEELELITQERVLEGY